MLHFLFVYIFKGFLGVLLLSLEHHAAGAHFLRSITPAKSRSAVIFEINLLHYIKNPRHFSYLQNGYRCMEPIPISLIHFLAGHKNCGHIEKQEIPSLNNQVSSRADYPFTNKSTLFQPWTQTPLISIYL